MLCDKNKCNRRVREWAGEKGRALPLSLSLRTIKTVFHFSFDSWARCYKHRRRRRHRRDWAHVRLFNAVAIFLHRQNVPVLAGAFLFAIVVAVVVTVVGVKRIANTHLSRAQIMNLFCQAHRRLGSNIDRLVCYCAANWCYCLMYASISVAPDR